MKYFTYNQQAVVSKYFTYNQYRQCKEDFKDSIEKWLLEIMENGYRLIGITSITVPGAAGTDMFLYTAVVDIAEPQQCATVDDLVQI